MGNDNTILTENIRKANAAISAGDYSKAKESLLHAAETALIIAKNSTGTQREKHLSTYYSIKDTLIKVSERLDNQITEKSTVNYTEKSEIHKTETVKPAKFAQNDSLSPKYLSDYIGQPQAVTAVKDLIQAALLKDTSMPHIILYGSHGLGKTSFAKIIANEMRTNFVEINASKITAVELIAILKKLKAKDIVFIDEIHTLPLTVAESVLYSAMQDGHITYMEGKGKFAQTKNLVLPPFTLIGATTEIGKLAKPFTQRAIQIRLIEYTDEVLGTIISASFYKLGMSITSENALYIARRCRNNPRIANNMVKRISDKALVRYAKQNNVNGNGGMSSIESIKKLNIRVEQNVIDDFFNENGIDEYGLEKGDRDLLTVIIKRYGGGPVGLDTLARVINESNNVIAQKYESYLIKKGFMKIEREGRVVMPSAYAILGLPLPEGQKNDTQNEVKKDEIKSIYDKRKAVAALVKDELKCDEVESLITYPDNVKEITESLDELFPDIIKEYEGVGDTKHLCLLEIDFDSFKREIICDSFLESRFATCMASVGYLKDIKAQSLELPYISQELANRRYFPDFIIKDYKNRVAIIEMKNYNAMTYHLNIDKYEKLKEYCNRNGYGYAEIMKGNNAEKYTSVEKIMNLPLNQDLSDYIYSKMESNGRENGVEVFTKKDLEEYISQNPDCRATDVYTVLLKDRKLKNIDSTGENLRIIKN